MEQADSSPAKIKVFSELSAQLSSLRVYLWSTDESEALSDMMPSLETLFKSTDGKFKLHIRHKQTRQILTSVVIKDKSMGMRIKPGLTQYSALDKNTLLFRFSLDSKHLSVGQIVKSVQRISSFGGPIEVDNLQCQSCEAPLTQSQTKLKIKSAPSANWREVVGLWQCHDEKFDQFFDMRTRQLKVPADTLLFNLNLLESHQATDFAASFPSVQIKDGKHLLCQGCQAVLGFVAPTNPLALSAACFVSSQRQEMDRRVEQQESLTHSFYAEKLLQFQGDSNFADRLKTCIYNHCIEDRQRNLALMAESETECQIITIKPLSHQAYIIYDQGAGADQAGKKLEPAQFTEANKILFSEITYDLTGAETQWAEGLIDFVKQISSVRRVTTTELQTIRKILKEGQQGIPRSILSVMGLYQLTYIS